MITSKSGTISRISNTLSETLRTYTFLVMVFIVGEIKSIMLKVWKIKLRNAKIGVPPIIMLYPTFCGQNFKLAFGALIRSLSLESSLRTVAFIVP